MTLNVDELLKAIAKEIVKPKPIEPVVLRKKERPEKLLTALAKNGQAKPVALVVPPAARVADLLSKVQSAGRSPKRLHAVLAAATSALRDEFTLGSMDQYLFLYRKAIARKFGASHPAIPMLYSQQVATKYGVVGVGFTADEVKIRKRDARRRVLNHQRHQIPIPDPAKLLKKANSMVQAPGAFQRGRLANRPRWDRMVIGLMLLTGRRPIELCWMGSFEEMKGEKYAVLFSGQAKTRNAVGTIDTYPIPTLAPAAFIIKYFRLMRQILPVFLNSLDYRKFCLSTLGKTMKEEFSGWRARDLRAIYARVGYHAFAPDDMTDLAWFASVLGHKTLVEEADSNKAMRTAEMADTLTAAYYQKFYIPGAKRRLKLNLT